MGSSSLTEAEARLADAVASRVVEQLRGGVEDMLTPEEVAERLKFTAKWVREHADDLGAVRCGDAPNSPLRYPASKVAEYLAASTQRGRPEEPAQPRPKPKARRRRRGSSGADRSLLPYKGDGGAA